MNLGRFFQVFLCSTVAGLMIGAVAGGLLGVAVPASLKVAVGSKAAPEVKAMQPAPSEREPGVAASGEGTVMVQPERGLPSHGAAFGASCGLVTGALFGVLLGLIDQFLLAFRRDKQAPQQPRGRS